MRLSKQDVVDPTRRRHFEISIDSPMHILSCLATQANTALPAYSSAAPSSDDPDASECHCPGAASRRTRRRSRAGSSSGLDFRDGIGAYGFASIGAPPTVQITGPDMPSEQQQPPRPMHLLRHPSFDPPAFDAEVPPPPLMSPPPRYETIVTGDGTTALADYFSRLAEEMPADDGPDDPSPNETEDTLAVSAHSGGRINLPLTPGGRIHRSMDERRTWLPPGHVT